MPKRTSYPYLGGVTLTPCHERYSLALALIAGEEDGATGNADHTRTMYSVVLSYQITDSLQYVFQHDNGWNDYDTAGRMKEEWYGINQYLIYTMNDCWSLGARLEWFRDDDGSRLQSNQLRAGGFNNLLGTGFNSAAFAGDYYNLTLGLNWSPSSNLTVRPEMRWDWSDDSTVAPFDDGMKDSQFLAAFDVIYLF
jgi:hypothetical protein